MEAFESPADEAADQETGGLGSEAPKCAREARRLGNTEGLAPTAKEGFLTCGITSCSAAVKVDPVSGEFGDWIEAPTDCEFD